MISLFIDDHNVDAFIYLGDYTYFFKIKYHCNIAQIQLFLLSIILDRSETNQTTVFEP